MYNDEHNLYHYTYRKDGSETETHPAPQAGPAPEYENGPQQPVQEMKGGKKNRVGMKLTALALCCALLGGAVGAGIVWAASGEEEIPPRSRSATGACRGQAGGRGWTDRDDRRGGLRRQCQQCGVHQLTGTSGTNCFGQPVETASAGSGFVLTERRLYRYQPPRGRVSPDHPGDAVHRRDV